MICMGLVSIPQRDGWSDFVALQDRQVGIATEGSIAVPDGPGLGRDPDPAILERYKVTPPVTLRN
jgi:hypothetical protein